MLDLWLVLVLSAAGYLALALFLATRSNRTLDSDEQHTLSTGDGWTLTLERYLPASDVPRHPTPVVLAHGLCMNGVSWALSRRASIPKALADQGHDVWIAAYRGERSATSPHGSSVRARFQYGLDDHAFQDVPAIIEAVREHTGSERVNWVGHSMGGILIYLYASRFGCDHLGRVVTLSSPVVYGDLGGALRPLLPIATRLLGWQCRAPLRRHFIYLLPLALFLPWISSAFAMHLPNTTVRERLTLFRGAVEDVSWQLLNWFFLHPTNGITTLFESGQPGLDRMTAPLLVVGSTGDRLAPVPSVRPGFDLAGATEKRWLLYGDEAQMGPSFGHSDLASSAPAVQWLLPEIVAWLEDRQNHSQTEHPQASAVEGH